jgi:hypothetical protein
MGLSPPPVDRIVNLHDSSGIARYDAARGHALGYDGVRTDYAVVTNRQLTRITEHGRPMPQPTVPFDSNFSALGHALSMNGHAGVGKFVIVIHNQDRWCE